MIRLWDTIRASLLKVHLVQQVATNVSLKPTVLFATMDSSSIITFAALHALRGLQQTVKHLTVRAVLTTALLAKQMVFA
mgnify:CR=1 FL=1